eukprot:3665837-Rhodomonas_salina.1
MLTSHASTREVVQALSALCLGFDELCEAGDAWRVQSAPDSYMVVAGQSQTDDDDHAARLVRGPAITGCKLSAQFAAVWFVALACALRCEIPLSAVVCRGQLAYVGYAVVWPGLTAEDATRPRCVQATIGLDMIKVARSISHPVCPGSLKIRVAVHSGPVRNGVVAGSLPRESLILSREIEVAGS